MHFLINAWDDGIDFRLSNFMFALLLFGEILNLEPVFLIRKENIIFIPNPYIITHTPSYPPFLQLLLNRLPVQNSILNILLLPIPGLEVLKSE